MLSPKNEPAPCSNNQQQSQNNYNIVMKSILHAVFSAFIIAPLALACPCDKQVDAVKVVADAGCKCEKCKCEKCKCGKEEAKAILAECGKCKKDKDKDKEEGTLA